MAVAAAPEAAVRAVSAAGPGQARRGGEGRAGRCAVSVPLSDPARARGVDKTAAVPRDGPASGRPRGGEALVSVRPVAAARCEGDERSAGIAALAAARPARCLPPSPCVCLHNRV